MGTLYQRKTGGTYYGYWTDVKGRHHRKSLATHDREVARARLRQYELVSTDSAAHSRHALTAAIGDLLNVVAQGNSRATWGSYKQKGSHLVRLLGNIELGDLTRDLVLGYVRHRRSDIASDSTIHKELVVLRRTLAEARERGLWAGDPRAIVPSIKVRYEPKENWLSEDDAGRLLATLKNPGRRLWTALGLLAGLRLSEIESLRWEHVDTDAKRLRVPGRKTASSWRVVPIGVDLDVMLRAERKRAKATPAARVVEHWPNVRRDLAVAIEQMNRAAAELAAKRKRKPPTPLKAVTPNDLRRTFASWLKQRGFDSLVVAQLLGHTSTRMVEKVYGRLADANFIAAVAALPRMSAA